MWDWKHYSLHTCALGGSRKCECDLGALWDAGSVPASEDVILVNVQRVIFFILMAVINITACHIHREKPHIQKLLLSLRSPNIQLNKNYEQFDEEICSIPLHAFLIFCLMNKNMSFTVHCVPALIWMCQRRTKDVCSGREVGKEFNRLWCQGSKYAFILHQLATTMYLQETFQINI